MVAFIKCARSTILITVLQLNPAYAVTKIDYCASRIENSPVKLGIDRSLSHVSKAIARIRLAVPALSTEHNWAGWHDRATNPSRLAQAALDHVQLAGRQDRRDFMGALRKRKIFE